MSSTSAVREQPAPPVVAPPPGNPRFPLVDSLRAVAAISVLLFHSAFYSHAFDSAAYGSVAGRLEMGVAVFFVISGFLLYRPFAAAAFSGRSFPRVRDYLRRRVLRIVPAYWLALTVLAIYPGLSGVFTDKWWVFYGFGQAYSQSTFSQGIPQAWTLCVEVSFYLALPLYAFLVRRLGDRAGRRGRLRIELTVLAVLAAACFAGRVAVLGSGPSLIPFSLLGLFDWFAVGMALAVASVWLAGLEPAEQPGWARFTSDHPGVLWAAALGAFVALGLSVPAPSLAVPTSEGVNHAINLVSALVGGLLLLPAVVGQDGGGVVRRFLAFPAVAWLGLISYGIYLWHTSILQQLAGRGLLDVLPAGDFFLLAPVGLVVAAAAAAGSYYVVERPLLRFKDARRGRRAG